MTASLFPGFTEERIPCGAVTLFVRHNAAPDRPALLLLHGYPQTSAMWHGVAPLLADRFHVICPDLRGYGRSDKPASAPDHAPYSKRAMADDFAALLDHFGHDSAWVGAHDRGARVAHRMALDHSGRVRALVLLDIAPTREMYANTSTTFARAYWHWYFLTQPAPFPETMIGHDPRAFWLGKCIRQAGSTGTGPFHPDAKDEYLRCFDDPAAIHASCEDYRAAATIDIAHDDVDGGRKVSQPLLALWARRGVIERAFDPLSLWRSRADDVTGKALDASHYMAEEIPSEIALHMTRFFTARA
ncbi:alpha/beta hydrolase [Pseudaestuariivita atlantica]|uniref:Alpha/beta hydrolase n=1 Tax=Pseudaestuariivita atlantica TaxID=1317121 RepID=A0A0L1JTL6_9RHOB|nr:alpha/beta hydrolase [Pseudaestuariivita atlantica]KNG95106.1 alpha/beta hydrolase [Pseudaestuariivita atlantica]